MFQSYYFRCNYWRSYYFQRLVPPLTPFTPHTKRLHKPVAVDADTPAVDKYRYDIVDNIDQDITDKVR